MESQNLTDDVLNYIASLPYWIRFIASHLLDKDSLSQEERATAYSYLQVNLALRSNIPEIELNIEKENIDKDKYAENLVLTSISEVNGVNALAKGQIIELNPSMTILFGANGSGKTGYVRLLKKAISARNADDILPDLNSDTVNTSVSAKMIFSIPDEGNIVANFPSDSSSPCFKQISVYDGNKVELQIDERNDFSFIPHGLTVFALLNREIQQQEQMLSADIALNSKKTIANDILPFFVGESKIKSFIIAITEKTTEPELNRYAIFSDNDKNEKLRIETRKNELLARKIMLTNEQNKLREIKNYINAMSSKLREIDTTFSVEFIDTINAQIAEVKACKYVAEKEKSEAIISDNIKGIGSIEWKAFIKASKDFSLLQTGDGKEYPREKDHCVFCHQMLNNNEVELIRKYWKLLESIAETNLKNAESSLAMSRELLKKMQTNLLPQDSVLAIWMEQNQNQMYAQIKKEIEEFDHWRKNTIDKIDSQGILAYRNVSFTISGIEDVINTIDETLSSLSESSFDNEINNESSKLVSLEHHERYSKMFDTIIGIWKNMIWVKQARKISWSQIKRAITDAQKKITDTYFNDAYYELFTKECINLDANFGVEVSYSGASGVSYRQLTVKSKNPTKVLSEGEQKVISLADYLAEMQLSSINRIMIYDDPVNSLDGNRKKTIAQRLVLMSKVRQVVVFTHDLVFLSFLSTESESLGVTTECHWIEKQNNTPGYVWLRNSPSYEKQYRSSEKPKSLLVEAKNTDCPPEKREHLLRMGFSALRTCYEVLVINELFCNVVKRYEERVSIDALSSVHIDDAVLKKLNESFGLCCRFMEGHSHSDNFSYVKPEVINLQEEIDRYEAIKKDIKEMKKAKVS